MNIQSNMALSNAIQLRGRRITVNRPKFSAIPEADKPVIINLEKRFATRDQVGPVYADLKSAFEDLQTVHVSGQKVFEFNSHQYPSDAEGFPRLMLSDTTGHYKPLHSWAGNSQVLQMSVLEEIKQVRTVRKLWLGTMPVTSYVIRMESTIPRQELLALHQNFRNHFD